MKSTDRSNHYKIFIKGKLDERWLRWFEGLEVTSSPDNETIIYGEFDQSALHGVFNRIRDLGLELISVQQQDSDSEKMKIGKDIAMSHFQIPQDLFHEQGYKRIDGIDHFYRIVGTGEPFVFLHGGPGMWHDELVPSFFEFAKDHQCIYYDQRGNGKSLMEKIDATNFTTDLLVDDLEAIRKEFGLEEVNIIGHSWGGLLGMYYASKYPQYMKRLILVDPAPSNTELLIKSYENMMARFSEADWNHLQAIYESEPYLAGDPDVHNEAMRLSEGVTFFNEQAREEYFKIAVFDETTAKNAVAINGPARSMKLNITVQDQLSNITCPTLIVQGHEDFIVPEAAELICQLIKDSQLTFIPESGHYPFMEAPIEFFNALNAFVDEA